MLSEHREGNEYFLQVGYMWEKGCFNIANISLERCQWFRREGGLKCTYFITWQLWTLMKITEAPYILKPFTAPGYFINTSLSDPQTNG